MRLHDYTNAHLHHIAHSTAWHRISVDAEQQGLLTLVAAASAAAEFHADMAEVAAQHGVRLFGVDRFDAACDGEADGQLTFAGDGLASRVTPGVTINQP